MEEKHYCHSCGSETEWGCQSCEKPVCDKCTVPFTQFNQIDYTLCNNCNDDYQEAYNEEKAEEVFFDSLEPEERKTYYTTNTILQHIKKTLNKLGK